MTGTAALRGLFAGVAALGHQLPIITYPRTYVAQDGGQVCEVAQGLRICADDELRGVWMYGLEWLQESVDGDAVFRQLKACALESPLHIVMFAPRHSSEGEKSVLQWELLETSEPKEALAMNFGGSPRDVFCMVVDPERGALAVVIFDEQSKQPQALWVAGTPAAKALLTDVRLGALPPIL